jgi:UDP-3-O-[3-hydroxymyristoyl] glucosamine N-acyltransferase
MAGGSSTGDYVVLAGQAGVVDHVTIGKGAIIGAQAGVTKDVGPGERVLGSPAVPFSEFTKSLWCLKRLPEWLQDLKSLKSRIR